MTTVKRSFDPQEVRIHRLRTIALESSEVSWMCIDKVAHFKQTMKTLQFGSQSEKSYSLDKACLFWPIPEPQVYTML